MTLVVICHGISQRMRLSGTVTEIWRLKDNGITTLTFIGHVTIRLPRVYFLWVVHSDHASIWRCSGERPMVV